MNEDNPQDSWQTGPIEDAKGRKVSQLDPITLQLSGRHDLIPAEQLSTIVREIGIGMTRANRVLLWSSIFCLVAFMVAVVILAVRLTNGALSLGGFTQKLLPFCFIWFAPFGLWMGTRGVRFQRIKRVMLKHRRCPHCGYDLKNLPPDETNGTTRCPECGSSWDLSG